MLIMHYYVFNYVSLIFTVLIEVLIKNIIVIAISKCTFEGAILKRVSILECIF